MVRRFVPFVVAIAAAVVLVLGVTEGELGQVWQKAAYVCFECIGVG